MKLKEFIQAVKEENKTLAPKEQRKFIANIIVISLFFLVIWGASVWGNIYILYTLFFIKFGELFFLKWLLALIIASYDAAIYLVSKEILSKLLVEEKINYSIKEAEKKYNVFISIIPELYKDGVNWNWQILWYDDKHEIEGTYMFGDNHEHPMRGECGEAAIDYLMILNKKGRNEEGQKEAIKIYRETYYK